MRIKVSLINRNILVLILTFQSSVLSVGKAENPNSGICKGFTWCKKAVREEKNIE